MYYCIKTFNRLVYYNNTCIIENSNFVVCNASMACFSKFFQKTYENVNRLIPTIFIRIERAKASCRSAGRVGVFVRSGVGTETLPSACVCSKRKGLRTSIFLRKTALIPTNIKAQILPIRILHTIRHVEYYAQQYYLLYDQCK